MLHVEKIGQGPDLVLLHGWGMHSGIWSNWIPYLQAHFCIHMIDLPGHGFSDDCVAENEPGDLDVWADAVLQVAPETAVWVAWSLGGLVALNAANRQAQRFEGLALVAFTPCFVVKDNWPEALPARVFEQFSEQLVTDYQRTLQRFLSLQVRGSSRDGEILRMMRFAMHSRPAARSAALKQGLDLLRNGDVREPLAQIKLPVFWLLGEQDTLVPGTVVRHFSNIPYTLVPGAGHAPFLSDPEYCAHHILRWFTASSRVEARSSDFDEAR